LLHALSTSKSARDLPNRELRGRANAKSAIYRRNSQLARMQHQAWTGQSTVEHVADDGGIAVGKLYA
jgi:hypothetical protein